MKIHAIQTGFVSVKASQPIGRGSGVFRQLNILFDSAWTEPLPIYAWAIETSEGLIVVDTGETSRTAEPGYFPNWHPYFRLAVRIKVAAEDEIGPRLVALGLDPREVRTVILTHLHTDHAGGLRHFPKSQILVSENELSLARGLAGRLRGYLPNRWPDWFAPQAVRFERNPLGPFPSRHEVTSDGSVVVVPTPGHTPGHISVIIKTEDVHYFLAGDATYTQQALLEARVDGVSPSQEVARGTIKSIVEYARTHPLVYLPAHDPESGARLKNGATVSLINGNAWDRGR